MKLSQVGQDSPGAFTASGDARERATEKVEAGFFERVWNGLAGKDVSRAGRFGMGMGDPLYGGAQIGARMAAQPGGGVPEAAGVMMPDPRAEERIKTVDTAVQQREAGYQQREKAAGLSGGFSSEWARLLGNIASPPNVALGAAGGAAGAGLGLAGRLGTAAAMGAASGAMEPVASGDFGTEKAKQAGFGAAGGLAGGAVGEATGSLLGKAIAGNSPREVDSAILSRYRSTVKPSRAGQTSAPQLESQDRRILTAVDQIVQNRSNLQLTDEAGNQIRGALPRSLRQFTESIDQTKRSVFGQYDQMARQAQTVEGAVPNPHLVPRFERAGQEAAAAAREVTQAQQALTAAAAQQSRAGNNVYMSSAANETRRTAEAALQRAEAGLQRSRRAQQSIRDSMYGPSVDLTPAASQLRRLARSPEVADVHPGLAAEANQLAENFGRRGFYGLGETQDVIQNLNRTLNAFYRNPTPETVSRPALLGPIVQTLREGLDQAIENATGPGYQALRLQYGALRSIEKDVAGAVQREANKIPGGIGGIFANLAASEEALRGVITLSPGALARAGGIKAGQRLMKYINDPNRAIERLFNRAATRGSAPPSPFRQGAGAAASYGFPAFGGIGGGLAGAEAERPPVGKPRPSVVGP